MRYALIRGVFELSEIETLRNNAFEFSGHKGDLLSNPSLRSVVLDDRVLAIAARILGSTPIYFGDSTCVRGDKSHGYHKDNADRYDPKAPDWHSNYTLIRFGLYLQDHSKHSGGLNIRVGSHNVQNDRQGRNIYLRTRPGDLVGWNMRTSHSRTGRLLRFVPALQLAPQRADRLPAFLFAHAQGERAALFFAYGRDDDHLGRYLRYFKNAKIRRGSVEKLSIWPGRLGGSRGQERYHS